VNLRSLCTRKWVLKSVMKLKVVHWLNVVSRWLKTAVQLQEQGHQTPCGPVFGSAFTPAHLPRILWCKIVSFQRRLSNSHPTRLRILSRQHHSTENNFRTSGRTGVQTGWGNWGSVEKKALNAKRHEVLLHTFPLSWPNSPSLLLAPVSNPCFLNILISQFSACLHQLFALSFVQLINCKHPGLPCLLCLTLFRWCQKGEDRHDHGYFGLTWLELLTPDFFSSLAWLVWH